MKKLNVKQKQLWDEIKEMSNEYQTKLELLTRKQMGVYYTGLDLTDVMVANLFSNFDLEYVMKIEEKTFFEPCVGIGNFVFSYLKYIYQNLELRKEQVTKLIGNIYVSDSDKSAKKLFLGFLSEFLHVFWGINLPKDFEITNVGGALIYDIESRNTSKIQVTEYFNIEKFDIVLTNPPYKSFRAESKHYVEKETYELDKKYYNLLKEKIKHDYKEQGVGTPNLYKIFVEEILKKYLKNDGYAYLLIPQSILKDKTSKKLREHILNTKKIISIINIDEVNPYIDAKQAVTALLVNNYSEKSTFEIINHYGTQKEERNEISYDDVNKNLNSAIIGLSKHENELIRRFHAFPKIKELEYITNMRGELDVTLNKKSIVSYHSYQLLRGRNLAPFSLKLSGTSEYVSDDFVVKSSKSKYIFDDRIACPQVSNMNAKKRLCFSYIPANYVLGNSCNFIHISENADNVDLYYLLALFNSDIYDWYFKVFSSNNHINNYEIDYLPIPILEKSIHVRLSDLAKEYLITHKSSTLSDINKIINCFIKQEFDSQDENYSNIEYENINKDCAKDILACFPNLEKKDLMEYFNQKRELLEIKGIEKLNNFDIKTLNSLVEKYSLIRQGKVLNNTSFKLSDLDLEMVKSVSPGGNWKEIPINVAKKSKRLMKIRETGGRTTLYGRLDYEQPSYTITTYFNRPGNGTNIHPTHNRVMSVREAARIQSFPDNYYFHGNKKNKLEQIGNAIPPLMSYQIAKKIKESISVNNSLDLFNGAGGMTTGFKMAGYRSVLMNDINEAALVTAKVNYPSANAFLGDLTDESNRNYIINYAKKNKVDIVNGGPPCQGFSMAGYRNIDDPRSKLIFDYVEVLKGVSPKVFVFENVQGILSHDKGNTFKELINLFGDVGYKVEAKLLNFSDYGVPQKRKRVIIIGVKNELGIDPKELFPKPTTTELENKTTVREAIYDLEQVPLDEKSYYRKCECSRYVKMLKLEESIDDFIEYLKTKSCI